MDIIRIGGIVLGIITFGLIFYVIFKDWIDLIRRQ